MSTIMPPTNGTAPPAIVYLDGSFIPVNEAKISVFDRGFLFGDSVYEVIRCFAGRGFAIDLHIQRLERALHESHFPPFDAQSIEPLGEQLLARNRLENACVYWQITRGTGPGRSHLPPKALRPTVFGCVDPTPPLEECETPATFSAALHEDQRWARCDIKSTNLLPNILGKIDANQRGAQEVIFHRDGLISEGGSTTVFIVHRGQLLTPPLNDPERSILHGITRRIIAGLPNTELIERPVTIDELRSADEIILAGTRTLLAAVTELDGQTVGTGQPGPMVTTLLARLVDTIRDAITARSR